MPVVETKGSATSQGYGQITGGSPQANWIDDVFSTYLYTGNGSTQTITNGIDLSGKGGLTWLKQRSTAGGHGLYDTVRGATQLLSSNNANPSSTFAAGLTSFNADGFSLGSGINTNTSGETYASWTFRKQAKFFDVVTWTGDGDGTGPKAKTHSLGSIPGCYIVKRTNTTGNWAVYQRSTSATPWNDVGFLDATDAWYIGSGAGFFGAAPTSTTFFVNDNLNQSGSTYVAYLFAHNAGGFGTAGTDNVISCGSYTGNGSTTGPTITLGYEPQWVLIKRTNSTGNWLMLDTMRGFNQSTDNELYANLSLAEGSGLNWATPLATGFQPQDTMGDVNASGGTYIYIAIRRPMKPPTTGTSVFKPIAVNSSTGTQQTTNFPVSLQISKATAISDSNYVIDRLRGVTTTSTQVTTPFLVTESTAIESTSSSISNNWNNTGFAIPSSWASIDFVYWNFNRASGFFDEVCYTGTGSVTTQAHNLTVVPELILVKQRTTSTANWQVYSASISDAQYLVLNTSAAKATGSTRWNSTRPTSSVFTVGTSTLVNASGNDYVAYLFATVAGVSKVGSYTGTGTVTQTINAGFGASGARYVLIKRTDLTGNWYVFDTARGFTSTSSPYLLLNSSAVQVTGNNGCYADNTGFTLDTNASATVNINGASYIYLAIS